MLTHLRSRFVRTTFLATALLCAQLQCVTPVHAALTTVETIDRVVGTGIEPKRGWFVTIRYTGWVYDENAPDKKGKQFIHSDDRGAPVSFVYGLKRALPGIEKGMEGMKAGGQRTLYIPAKFAFKGARQDSPDGVSVDADLVIDLELVDVVPQANTKPSND
jgi:FKBP-type peptidyl-prolyl cis-trans isomerase FkpA